MGLLIKNGLLVDSEGRQEADLYCENETITKIGKNLEVPPGTEVIDAKGKYVFPGFIDPHVHIHLPFMGTFAKDTHETGSKAALVGGTTMYIEMCCPNRGMDILEGYYQWKELAEGNSACDFSFHMAVPKWEEGVTDKQLKTIIDDGITSFKIFLAYKDFLGVYDDELFKILSFAAENNIIVTAHTENADLIAEMQMKLLGEGKTESKYHEKSRPDFVEASGVDHFAAFLETTGARGYVVHLSNILALNEAIEARKRGVRLGVEVVIPHLILDYSYAEKEDFEGAKYVMSPPLRQKKDQEALWAGLNTGLVDTVATDHCPFDFSEQKIMGKEDFTKIPNGIPAIEDRINLLYTYGVSRGDLSLEKFVQVGSTNSAKLFGLYPRKGSLSIGADADLVIYDPEAKGVFSASTQTMNCDYNGFEGMERDGKPSVVTVRGKVQVKDGKFVGEDGRGRLAPRDFTG
jgi:dihydropyrimidinase